MKRILALFLLLALPVFAANHYIRAGASGANNGTSWTDAWTTFGAASWTRGDTYYVAGGTYTETVTVSANLSGTTRVTVKKANAADNGGDPGWSASYASTVATIVGEMYLNKGYITLDGVTGSGKSGHGIYVHRTSTSAGSVINLDSDGGHFTVQHVNVEGPGYASSAFAIVGINHNPIPAQKGNYFGYLWVHQTTTAGIFILSAVGASYVDYGFLFENNVISETGGCTDPDNHGQAICLGGTGASYGIIRNSIFSNVLGSAMIALLVGLDNVTYNQVQIYNCVFTQADPVAYNGLSPGPIWCEAIKSHTGCTTSNVLMANNTFYNITGTSNLAQITFEISTAGVVQKNSIYENCHFTSATLGLTTDSNNGYYNNNGGSVPSGTTNQVNGSATTFIDAATANFGLVTGGYAVGAGLDLSATFTTDAAGTTRNVPWDLGAYAYGSNTGGSSLSGSLTIGGNAYLK